MAFVRLSNERNKYCSGIWAAIPTHFQRVSVCCCLRKNRGSCGISLTKSVVFVERKIQAATVLSRLVFSMNLLFFPLHFSFAFLYCIGDIVNFIRIEEIFKKIRDISVLQELKINGRGKSSVINTWILICVHIMKRKRARDHIHNDAANFRMDPVS